MKINTKMLIGLLTCVIISVVLLSGLFYVKLNKVQTEVNITRRGLIDLDTTINSLMMKYSYDDKEKSEAPLSIEDKCCEISVEQDECVSMDVLEKKKCDFFEDLAEEVRAVTPEYELESSPVVSETESKKSVFSEKLIHMTSLMTEEEK